MKRFFGVVMLLLLPLSVLAETSKPPVFYPPFKKVWQMDAKSEVLDYAASGKALYCVTGTRIAAIDAATGKTLWANRLPKAHKQAKLASSPTRLFVLTDDKQLACYDAQKGRVVWKTALKEHPLTLVADQSGVYIESTPGKLTALSAESGKERWRYPFSGSSGAGALVAQLHLGGSRLYAVTNGGQYVCLNPANGSAYWSEKHSSSPDDRAMNLLSDDSRLYTVWASGTLSALDLSTGKILWTTQVPKYLVGKAALTDTQLIVRSESKSFSFLAATGESAWSEEDGIPAHDLIADRTDPRCLMPHWEGVSSFDAKGRELWCLSVPSSDFSSFLPATGIAFAYGGLLIQLGKQEFALYAMGDPEPSPKEVPKLIAAVRKELTEPYWSRDAGDSFDQLRLSKDPRAINFLISLVNNPKVSADTRTQAFISLARTGTKAGADAVLAIANEPHPAATLRQAVMVDSIPVRGPYPSGWPRVLDRQKDANGNEWVLLQTAAVGSHGDLWVARSKDGKWDDPVFTGVTTEKDFPKDWVTTLTGRPELAVDTDSDGWPDIIEQRLLTDPKKADTDGDGVKDPEDTNPRTASRPLDDTAQVLAAAFEARFLFEKIEEPLVVDFPEGVKPFELKDYGWVITPSEKDSKAGIYGFIGDGTTRITFGHPGTDIYNQEIHDFPPDTASPIIWNASRTEAKVEIYTYHSNLGADSQEVRVKKVNGHWVAVEMTLTAVS